MYISFKYIYIYIYIYILEFTVATLPNSSPPLALRGGSAYDLYEWSRKYCMQKNALLSAWPLFDLFWPPLTFNGLWGQNDIAYDAMGYHTGMYVKKILFKVHFQILTLIYLYLTIIDLWWPQRSTFLESMIFWIIIWIYFEKIVSLSMFSKFDLYMTFGDLWWPLRSKWYNLCYLRLLYKFVCQKLSPWG